VPGDPRLALTWLANEVSRLGAALDAGQVVTTGTCLVPMEVCLGDAVSADSGALGSIAFRFVG
jgi:2-keto-4-pentenoate hydratase